VVAQPATLGQSSLKFSFVDQSWVTVRDANNSVLMSQLNQPGSNIEVVGQGPFKVIVGNAKAVTLSHNGKPVELNSSIRGEVARLTIQ
jgi:cytoskeleton protein RodZ